jgi:hypothetical protein
MKIPHCLQFSQPLEPKDVSQAWEYLFSLSLLLPSKKELPPPPEHLQNLVDSDWFLLSNLLAQELHSKEHSRVH